MIKKIFFLLAAAAFFTLAASENAPFRICVLELTTIDEKAQQRFLNERSRPLLIPAQCTLNDADRKSVNGVMQGFVRMIDAWSSGRTAQGNRIVQLEENRFNRQKALDLYRRGVNGPARPAVIGAEYLAAELGRHADLFSCFPAAALARAAVKLQNAPDFPQDFWRKLAAETGVTHLLTGTVSDLRVSTSSFKGYGIEAGSIRRELDVIVILFDLKAQRTVYSRVCTGVVQEQIRPHASQLDHAQFQTLMKAAMRKAADELYEDCRQNRKNGVKPDQK